MGAKIKWALEASFCTGWADAAVPVPAREKKWNRCSCVGGCGIVLAVQPLPSHRSCVYDHHTHRLTDTAKQPKKHGGAVPTASVNGVVSLVAFRSVRHPQRQPNHQWRQRFPTVLAVFCHYGFQEPTFLSFLSTCPQMLHGLRTHGIARAPLRAYILRRPKGATDATQRT